jgi:hypothetical protein
MQGPISLLLASSVFSCKILIAITEIARENTEKIAVNILHENTEEANSNEIGPCINVNAKQIEAILKQG